MHNQFKETIVKPYCSTCNRMRRHAGGACRLLAAGILANALEEPLPESLVSGRCLEYEPDQFVL